MFSTRPRRTVFSLTVTILASVVVLTGFGCRRPSTPGDEVASTVVVWGLWQESAQLEPIFAAFEQQYGVKVDYKKLASVATYEKELLEALAQGRGPDVFVIHHSWVESKRGLMSPAPPDVVDERAVREEFVDVVAQDLIRDGFVYALPTSVDTLALYYNKDLLAGAGVARPPATWQEFQRATERVTQVTRTGLIRQSAAALGTASNVNRAADILQLLMLQSGLKILDAASGRSDIASQPGEQAMIFFTDFSNTSKKVYTWNLQQDYSIDSFSEGGTAMMVNYSYHIPTIRAKNPRLSFAVAPLPQIADSTPRNFAAYWPFGVSNTSRAPVTAWNLVRFMTSKAASETINQAQGVPPARRDSVETFARHPELGVFAEQTLTATTWPRVDIVTTDAVFNRLIDDIVTGKTAVTDALGSAKAQLEELYASKRPSGS